MWTYGQKRVQREAEEAMVMAELAGTNAYANVTVKGHVKERQREWQKLNRQEPTGKANVAGWQQLAGKFQQMGLAVEHGGERFVQP